MTPVETVLLKPSSVANVASLTMQERDKISALLDTHEPKMRRELMVALRFWASVTEKDFREVLAILRAHLAEKQVPRIGDLHMIDLPIAYDIIHGELENYHSKFPNTERD